MHFRIETPQQRSAVIQYLLALPLLPVMGVAVKEWKRNRSNSQNAYYWSVVLGTISDFTGHGVEELHEFFKRKYLAHEDLTVLGQEVQVYPTTTKLNVKDFSVFLDKITQFAQHELGCYLPQQES